MSRTALKPVYGWGGGATPVYEGANPTFANVYNLDYAVRRIQNKIYFYNRKQHYSTNNNFDHKTTLIIQTYKV